MKIVSHICNSMYECQFFPLCICLRLVLIASFKAQVREFHEVFPKCSHFNLPSLNCYDINLLLNHELWHTIPSLMFVDFFFFPSSILISLRTESWLLQFENIHPPQFPKQRFVYRGYMLVCQSVHHIECPRRASTKFIPRQERTEQMLGPVKNLSVSWSSQFPKSVSL